MRKTKRLTAMLLAVITICGLIPFSMFAVSAAGAEPWESATRQELIDAVGAENIIVDNPISSNSKYCTMSTDPSALAFGNDAKNTNYATVAKCFTAIKNSEGDYAWQYGSSEIASGDEAYVEIRYKGIGYGKDNYNTMHETAAKEAWLTSDFVLSIDIKAGDVSFDGSLLTTGTRVNSAGSGFTTFTYVYMIDDYLYANADKTIPLAKLSKDKYTNVAAYVDRSVEKYYIYIDGVNMTPDGYPFTAAIGADATYEWTIDDAGTNPTVKKGEYYLVGARMLQISGEKLLALKDKASYAFDDIRLYFTDEGFVGERTVKDTVHNGVLIGADGKLITTDGTYTVGGLSYFVQNGKIIQERATDLVALSTGSDNFFNALNYKNLENYEYTRDGFSNFTLYYNTEANKGATDISAYDAIKLDIYVPAENNASDVIFTWGGRERSYILEYVGEPGGEGNAANYVLVDKDEDGEADYEFHSIGEYVTATIAFADGTGAIGGRFGKHDNKYYLRTWDYSSKYVSLDGRDIPGVTGELRLVPGQWNTIELPVASNFQEFKLNNGGWSVNNGRGDNKDNVDIKIANIRLVNNIDATNPVGSGWSTGEVGVGSYVRPGTVDTAKGVQLIDGLWYQFSPVGVCMGLVDGMAQTTFLYKGSTGATESKTINRYFIDGVLQFGTFEDGGNTYVADANTGELDKASSQIACSAHIPSTTQFVYDDNDMIFFNHHYQMCKFCGIKLNPVEHDFRTIDNGDGTHTLSCEACGKEETIEVLKELKVSSINLTLYDKVQVKFAVNADDLFCEGQYKEPSIIYNFNNTADVTITDYDTEVIAGKNYYIFKAPLIKMKNLGDTFTFKLKAKEYDSGKEVTSMTKTSSVKTYCYAVLANSTNAELDRLLVDILNYGAAAQTYYNHNTDSLVNADLTPEQAAKGTQTMPDLVDGTNSGSAIKVSGITYMNNGPLFTNATISSEGKIKMTFKMGTVSLDNVYVKVSLASDPTVFVKITSDNFTDEGDGKYSIQFLGITAAQMRECIHFDICKGDDYIAKNTYEYSIDSYMNWAAGSEYDETATGVPQEKIVAMLEAMLAYGDSAKNYLDKVIDPVA